MKKTQTGGWLVWTVLGVTLAFYFLVAWAVPWCVTDDLQWGMEQGVRWWRYGLLNGRYVGNLFALIMCHFEPLKVLVMGAGMFAIPFLMAALMCRGERGRFLPQFMLANALIMAMPGGMWMEVYGWISGFGNYGLSVVLFLVFLLLARECRRAGSHPRRWAAAMFFTALAMGQFLESETVLFLGGALVMGIYASIWEKPLRLPYWAGFAGAALAAAVMFSNGVLVELAYSGTAMHGLRNLTFSLEDGLVRAVKDVVKQYMFHRIPVAFWPTFHIALPLAVITFFGFWRSRFRVLAVLGAVPLGVCRWLLDSNDYVGRFNGCAACACWALAFLALAVQEEGGLDRKLRRMMLFLTAPLSLLPLAATGTLGQRFYFFPMVMLLMVTLDELGPLLECTPGGCVAAAMLAVTLFTWSGRSATVGKCNVLREELIRQAVAEGADRVILPADRYVGVFWMARTPWTPEYACYFRDFYGIPEDVTLIFLPAGSFETWPDWTEEQWAVRTEMVPTGPIPSSLP